MAKVPLSTTKTLRRISPRLTVVVVWLFGSASSSARIYLYSSLGNAGNKGAGRAPWTPVPPVPEAHDDNLFGADFGIIVSSGTQRDGQSQSAYAMIGDESHASHRVE